MRHLKTQLEAGGAFVTVTVAISIQRWHALNKENLPIPEDVTAKALLDTGASVTMVDKHIIDRFGLSPKAQVSLHTPSTEGQPKSVSQFDLSLAVHGQNGEFNLSKTLSVLATSFEGLGFDVLIGRDILSQMLMIYDGVAEDFTLAF
jgi:hypothetical protein